MTSENKDIEISLNSEICGLLLGVDNLVVESCGRVSRSVHSRYERTLMSLPVSAHRMTITFRARKFRCRNPRCGRGTFSEQVGDLTERYSRITVGVRRLMEKGLPEMSAVKYSRISDTYGIPRSPSTCLRMTYRIALPEPDRASVKRVHIDDFALRKGQEYRFC